MLKPVVPQPDLNPFVGGANLSDVTAGVLDVLARLLKVRLAAIARIESTAYTLMAVVDQHNIVRAGQMLNLHETFCVHMLESGQPLRINDTRRAAVLFRTMPIAFELNIRSYVGVPLKLNNGGVFGALWIADAEPREFSDEDISLLQLLAHLLTHELERDADARQSERIAQARAMHTTVDPLTGLITRNSFEAIVARETARRQRYGTLHALAVLQLTPPDAVAERYGYHGLDMLRRSLADIVMRTSRLVDCCASLGVNEFAVLFLETTSGGVEAWQMRISAAIEVWNRLHAASGLVLDVTIGIADAGDTTNARESDESHASLVDVARRRIRRELSPWIARPDPQAMPN